MAPWKSAVLIVVAATIGIGVAWAPTSLGNGHLHVDPIPAAELPLNLSEPLLTPTMIQDRGVETLGGLNSVLAAGALIAALTTLLLLAVARASNRRSEILVRRAVGASRRRLLHMGANEGFLMAFIALTVGSALGLVTQQYAQAQWPGTITAGAPLLPLLIAAGVGVAILLGVLVPLRSIAGGAMRPHLPPLTALLAPAICALQVAVCFALLVQSQHVVREGVTLTRDGPGAGGQGRVFQLEIAATPAQRARQLAELIKRTGLSDLFDVASFNSPGALNGVGTANVAIAECGMCSQGGIATPLRPVAVSLSVVSADTFRALNTHLIEGRWIRDTDDWRAPRVAVISQGLARAHFQNGEALGRAIQLGQSRDNRFVVVGVVDDPTPRGLGSVLQPAYAVYTSILQVAPTAVELLLRPPGAIDWSAMSVIPPALIRAALPEVEWRARTAAPVRWFGATLLSNAAAIALIALLGSMTAVAMWIGSMLPELAVRRSVGARRRDVLRYVIGRCTKMLIAGVALGLVLAFLSADPLSAIVPGVHGLDTATIVQVALTVIAVTGIAIGMPVWRACRLTPIELLTKHDL